MKDSDVDTPDDPLMDRGERRMLRFMVLGLAVTLGFVGGVIYDRNGFDLTHAFSVFTPESVGDRLQRECASVVDTAGVRVAPFQVINVLKTDAANANELGPFEQRWQEFRTKYPDRWNEAFSTAIAQARDEMIRNCVLKRGTSP